MSIKLSKVVQRVAELLDDIPGDSWSPGEITGYAIEAVRVIASRVPAAYTTTTTMTLVDGPRQVAPAEAITVVDVPFSISPTGQRQRAVTAFEPKTLAAFRPTWVSDTPGVVRQWAPDATDPKVFWVYPPAIAGNKAEVAYPVAPPEVITQDVIPMDSNWAPAIIDYCLGRALGKDAEFAADPARAAFYMTAFYKRFPSDSST